jgi:hypothetical protein
MTRGARGAGPISDLEFTGDVDFSGAQSGVDAFAADAASRLSDALGGISVESFVSTLSAAAADALSTPIPVEADASAIPVEVDAALADSAATIPIDADTTLAASAAADLTATIDGENAAIQVDAD